MTKKALICPGCFDGESVRPSHFRVRDVPFMLVGLRTYRCLLCYRRFRAWGRPPDHVTDEHVGKKNVGEERPRKLA